MKHTSNTGSTANPRRSRIELHWRWIAFVTGALIVIASVSIFLWPPLRTTNSIQTNPAGSTTTSTEGDPTTYCVPLLMLGAGLILYAVNGLRVGRVSKEGFDLLPDVTEQEIVTATANAKVIETVAKEEPPAGAGSRSIVVDGTSHRVYMPNEIPLAVIDEVVKNSEASIKCADDIEYGLRREGSGNHKWFLKTKQGSTWTVSFGGKGKTTGTAVASPLPGAKT